MIMKSNLKVRQLPSGCWAVFNGERYYNNSVSETEREAQIKRLYRIGQDAQAVLDEVDRELEKLGALGHNDP